MAKPGPTTITVQVPQLDQLYVLIEEMEAELHELRNDASFWRNEYEEVLSCIGGRDPRR